MAQEIILQAKLDLKDVRGGLNKLDADLRMVGGKGKGAGGSIFGGISKAAAGIGEVFNGLSGAAGEASDTINGVKKPLEDVADVAEDAAKKTDDLAKGNELLKENIEDVGEAGKESIGKDLKESIQGATEETDKAKESAEKLALEYEKLYVKNLKHLR